MVRPSAYSTSPSARRAVSLLLLITSLAASLVAWGLGEVKAVEVRGRELDFPMPVFGAEELLFGVNVALEQYDPDTLDARLAALAAQGVRLVRQEFRWADLEPRRGVFEWHISDHIFAALRKHRLRVLPVLWTTPAWARAPSASAAFPPTLTAPPQDVDDFARFVAAFAARYDQPADPDHSPILAYQIWDEPNLSAAWGNGLINPTYYLQLLRAARAAIHAVNSRARIVLAALAPTVEQSNVNMAPQLYLLKLYQLGGHQAFDIVAAKPYGFDFAPDDRRVSASVLNFSHVVLMREVMVAHNEGHKAIWATQFGWNALPPGWQGEPSIWGQVSEAQQASFTVAAVQRAAREWHWLGAMFLDVLQPRPRPDAPERDARWGFALLDADGRPRSVFEVLPRAVAEAAHAVRPQLFARCDSPQSVYRALHLDNVMTAMPEVLAAKPDCREPNPRAAFTDGWRFDQLGADVPDDPSARVRFTFYGDALALIVRRGNYRAYVFASVDGQPANRLPQEPRGAYLVMTSAGLYPVIERVPVADGLGPGQHVAELHVDRGWNQWSLIGWSTMVAPDLPPYDLLQALFGSLALAALIGALHVGRCAGWINWLREQVEHSRQAMRAAAAASAAGLALIAWLGAALAWAQDAALAWRSLPLAPQVVVSGLVSAVFIWMPAMLASTLAAGTLMLLIVIRPTVGLTLLAFSAPFYLLPQRLFERAVAMPELLTLMCAMGWVVQVLLAWQRTRLRFTWQSLLRRVTLFDAALALLVLVATLSAVQARFRVEALRELRLVIIEPALAYLVLRTLPDRSRAAEQARWIVGGLVAGAVAVALIGLANYARGVVFADEFGLPRIRSVFGSPNNDALYLERGLALALGLAAGAAHRRERGVWLASCAAMIVALVLSQSRGALLLGVPMMLVATGFAAGGRWRYGALALAAAMALVCAVLAVGLAQPWLEGTRFARLADPFDLRSGTGFFRLSLWESALRMWRDHPLLGVGPDNFLYAYRSFYILPAAWQEPNLSHPHNLLLDFAARLGLLGLLAGAGLIGGFVVWTRQAWSRDRGLALGAVGFLAVMLSHGLVDHALFLVDLSFAFMLTAGALARLTGAP